MSLRKFLDDLDREGLLARVRKPVDARYEITSVVRKLAGRPVLFENVRGFAMPVVSNVCSSKDIVCRALGLKKEELIPALTRAIEHPKAPQVNPAEGYFELPVDLGLLPILTYYPRDGGPYIASGIAFAEDREYGVNASYHRAMVIGEDRLVLRILERHLHEFMKRGLREFAYCVGNDIPVLLGAAVSAELGKSELAIANALREIRVARFDGRVAPESEIVMLCEFTGEQADEGPFLDLTETFDVVRRQPVARVRKIYARENAFFHALLPGELEHKLLMGMPREPTIFREVSKVCNCLDVSVTPGGCSWLHAVVRIQKRRPEDGKEAIEAAFRGHASLKHVFVVDEDIDIYDPASVEWAMATRFQGTEDLVVKARQKGSSLDPSADPMTRETAKVGFDLTVPPSSRGKDFTRALPPMDVRWEDYVENRKGH